MTTKLLPHIRFLNPPLPVTRLPQPIKLGPTFQVFAFKRGYLGFALSGPRRLSTRSFRPGRGGEVRVSKSLVEDEAQLSDWVSDLNGGSLRGRRAGSYGEDGLSSGRGRGFASSKRRREGEFVQRSNWKESRGSRRFGSEEEDEEVDRFGSWRDSGGNRARRGKDFGDPRGGRGVSGRRGFLDDHSGYNVQRKNRGRDELVHVMGGRRERDFGGKRDGNRASVKRDFLDDDNEEEEEEEEEDERLAGGLGDFLREGLTDDDPDSDQEDGNEDDGNYVLKRDARSSHGLQKDFSAGDEPSFPGNSVSYLSETRFDQCAISPLSLKGIKDAGYEKMTVVQEATLPVILKGKDVLAKAKTGTGKTVAFLLPSIEVVVKSPAVSDKKRPPILVLVICPTRELASQAATEANTLLKYYPSIGVQVVMGGTRLALEQKRMQANPCQILVATPGRLRDHIENTVGFATRLMGVKVFVLDEADHLLDMGFRKDIEKIIAAVPKQRQTLLFSATVPEEVRQICHLALKRDHEYINTVQEGTEETHSQVRQMHLVAPLEKQFPLLYTILKDHIADNVDYKVLVFCTTAMVTRLVADFLGELRLNVREIHSRKPQSYRTRVSDEFRKSKGLILVTSDVSARGVDYPDVTLVVQVGLPADREQYIHRLGRTGRKGKEGQGILLLAPWEEFFISTVKDLPMTKASLPPIDPDTKKKVERALFHVEMKNKEAAYQAWLGYYNSNRVVGKDKYRLVELANEFSRSMGLDNPPAIPKLVLGKMGLRNIPGLRSK